MWNVTFADVPLVSCKLLMNRRNERSPQHLSASSPLLQQPLRGNHAVFSIWPLSYAESCWATFCCYEITHGCNNLFVSNPLLYQVNLRRGECLGRVEDIDHMLGVNVSVDTAYVSFSMFSALSTSYTFLTDEFGAYIAEGLTPFRCSQVLCVMKEFSYSFAVKLACFVHTSTITHYVDSGSHPAILTSSSSLSCCKQLCYQCASPRYASPPSN